MSRPGGTPTATVAATAAAGAPGAEAVPAGAGPFHYPVMPGGGGALATPTGGHGLRRRGVEVALSLLALAAVAAADIAVGVSAGGSVPTSDWPGLAGLAAMTVVAAAAIRLLAPYADPVILPVAVLLNGLGLVVIHRLDVGERQRAALVGGVPARADALPQLVWTGVAVGGFVLLLALVRDHRRLTRWMWTAGLVGLVLLFLPGLLPASISQVNGAKLWIRLGPMSVQPGEFAKLLLAVFFAAYLTAKREALAAVGHRIGPLRLPRGRDLGPVLAAWLLTLAVLVLEGDLGTALLFFGIFLAMLYVATGRPTWVLIGLALFAAGATMAWLAVPKVGTRLDIWLHPFNDPTGSGYQTVQGLIGLASGGIFGVGLGQGNPGIVPYAKSDFITASLGEELGLIGLSAVLVLLLVLVSRALRASLSVRDDFGRLLAAGLAASLAIQVFVVVGGVSGLIPLTGLTLPFLAYGGSSLLSSWLLVALVVRISDAARRPSPGPVNG